MRRAVEAAARAALRAPRLGFELARAAAELSGSPAPDRSLHLVCRRLADVLGLSLEISGAPPPAGLVVCNHLGYLDVVALAAAAPAVFVAKSEVRSWPVFGALARLGATVFVERERPGRAHRSLGEIEAALAAGRRVVLFPEGTSSPGHGVLPFKSALFECARGRPVWAAALRFDLEPGDGDAARDVCYWGNMTLLPHLLGLLGRRRILGRVAFAPLEAGGDGRKELAARAHARVAALHARLACDEAELSAGRLAGFRSGARPSRRSPAPALR